MARPSSRSTSFVHLAQQKSKSRTGTGHEHQNDNNVTFSSDIETDPEKQALQNKALVKNNAILKTQVNDMEKRISDLISENIQLKQRRGEVEVRKHLDHKLSFLEGKLKEKVNDVWQVLKEFREAEGLEDKEDRTSYKSSPIISPLLSESIERSDRRMSERSDSIRSIDHLIKSSQPLTQGSNGLQALNIGLSSVVPERRKSFTFRRQTQNVIPIYRDKPVSESPEALDDPEAPQLPPLDGQDSFPIDYQVFPDPQGSSDKENKTPSDSGKSSEIESTPTPILRVRDSKRLTADRSLKDPEGTLETTSQITAQKAAQKTPHLETQSTTETKSVSKKIDVRTRRKSRISRGPTPVPKIQAPKTQTPTLKERSETPVDQENFKRPTRTKTAIDYKEPSLGKKLRRQSEHFVDAVTEDYYTAIKRQKLDRLPLQAKSSNQSNSQPPQSKGDSIFDFVGDAPRSRRYTMNN